MRIFDTRKKRSNVDMFVRVSEDSRDILNYYSNAINYIINKLDINSRPITEGDILDFLIQRGFDVNPDFIQIGDSFFTLDNIVNIYESDCGRGE